LAEEQAEPNDEDDAGDLERDSEEEED